MIVGLMEMLRKRLIHCLLLVPVFPSSSLGFRVPLGPFTLSWLSGRAIRLPSFFCFPFSFLHLAFVDELLYCLIDIATL